MKGYDLKARSGIHLYLMNEVFYNILNENSVTKLWLKLKILYIKKSLLNCLYLKQKLYTMRMKKGIGIFEHLNEFNKIIYQLTSIESKFEEEDKDLLLLSLFPSSYEHLVTIIFYGKDSIELERIKAVFLSNNMRKKSFIDEVEAKDLLVV